MKTEIIANHVTFWNYSTIWHTKINDYLFIMTKMHINLFGTNFEDNKV